MVQPPPVADVVDVADVAATAAATAAAAAASAIAVYVVWGGGGGVPDGFVSARLLPALVKPNRFNAEESTLWWELLTSPE